MQSVILPSETPQRWGNTIDNGGRAASRVSWIVCELFLTRFSISLFFFFNTSFAFPFFPFFFYHQMPWRLMVDFSDDYPAIQFFAALEREKNCGNGRWDTERKKKWMGDSFFESIHVPRPDKKIDLLMSWNQWNIFCWTGDNKQKNGKVILLLLFRLAKCDGKPLPNWCTDM